MSMTAFLMLGLAHFFDYASFLVMTSRHGLMAEYNPLVVALAQLFGLPGLTLMKVASVVLLTAVVIIISPRRPKLAASVLVIGVCAGLVGGLSNVTST